MKSYEFCPVGEQEMTAFLEGRLKPEARRKFAEHAEQCSVCREELRIWEEMEQLAAPRPGPYFKRDFEAMLERESRRTTGAVKTGRPQWLAWAVAAALAVGGYVLGNYNAARDRQPEVAELRAEVKTMRTMMAMSMLQQQSAVERLRGVSYSVALENPDREVVEALVETLRGDSSVDVRLAAVDALRKYAQRPEVRKALGAALPVQDSPLVQLELIETLVDLKDKPAAPELRRMVNREDVDPTVKTRLVKAIAELQEQ